MNVRLTQQRSELVLVEKGELIVTETDSDPVPDEQKPFFGPVSGKHILYIWKAFIKLPFLNCEI